MPHHSDYYIPRPDGNFTAWAAAYYEAVKPWWSANGFKEELLAPLNDALDNWLAAYPMHTRAQAAAESARQAKDAARAALEAQVRPITNIIQSWPKTTDADRATMGITVRDTRRTPAARPTSRPIVSVNPANRLQHELRLVDEASPTRRGKPVGASAAEVWVRLVEPNGQIANGQVVRSEGAPDNLGDPALFTFLTMTTRPTLRTDFPSTAGGKTAAYMLRWVNARGEKGPWSEVCAATVAA